MQKEKRQAQLGMNPSTAQQRLVKDILYKLVVDTGQNSCFKCGGEMSRATFSIEHKEAWMDSEEPLRKFFDLNNISFSHLICNIKTARKPTRKYHTDEERRSGKAAVQRAWKARNPEQHDPVKRREKYLAKGH